MAIKRFAAMALLALGAHAQASVAADELPILDEAAAAEQLTDSTSPPTVLDALRVTARVAFPDSSPLGIKLVNGHATTALFTVRNDEPAPIRLRMLGGSLWSLAAADLKHTSAVRNLSTALFQTEVAPGTEETLTYKFATELHPQDLRLLIAGLFEDERRNAYQLEGFNGTVSIVEAPFSIFNPQTLFIYTFLTALFLGTLYLIYTVWLAPLLPGAKNKALSSYSGRGKPALKSVPSAAKVPLPADDSDGARASGTSTTYDESWIDKRHLERPGARRVKSGASGRAGK